jgi:hypothetical protein
MALIELKPVSHAGSGLGQTGKIAVSFARERKWFPNSIQHHRYLSRFRRPNPEMRFSTSNGFRPNRVTPLPGILPPRGIARVCNWQFGFHLRMKNKHADAAEANAAWSDRNFGTIRCSWPYHLSLTPML